jgi:hypothetical protein
MKIAAVVVTVLLGVAGWNYAALRSVQNPVATQMEEASRQRAIDTAGAKGATREDAIEMPWSWLEKVRVPATQTEPVEYPAEIGALAGKWVHMAGVFTPMDALKRDGVYLGGALQPPDKLSCCGLTCDPRTQLLVFIDCSARPWMLAANATAQGKSLVSVTGRLELVPTGSAWGCTSLLDAQLIAFTPANSAAKK